MSDDCAPGLRRERKRLESLSKSDWDIKHAAGGLYDISFIEALPTVSGGTTISEKLEKLVSGEHLGKEEATTLLGARRLYYLIMHAASHHELVYPPIPEHESFFEEYLGRLLGHLLPGEGSTLDRLRSVRRSVREIFDMYLNKLGGKPGS
jgi:hypothetical protein